MEKILEVPDQLKLFTFIPIKRGEKGAKVKEWQLQENQIDYDELLNRGLINYGVPAKSNKLVIIDIDQLTEPRIKQMVEILPKTFTVETGKGAHLYYHNIDIELEAETVSRDDENNEEIFSIRWGGAYVIGPGSKHPNGNIYKARNDEPIADLDKATVNKVLELFPVANKPIIPTTTIKSVAVSKPTDNKWQYLIDFPVEKVLEHFGYDPNCKINPIHGSSTGNNWQKTEPNMYTCFHSACNESLGAFDLFALCQYKCKCSEAKGYTHGKKTKATKLLFDQTFGFVKPKDTRTTMKTIRDVLVDLNITIDKDTMQWQHNNNPLKLNTLYAMVYTWLEEHDQKTIGLQIFETLSNHILTEEKLKLKQNCLDRIKYNPNAVNKVAELIDIICGDTIDEIDKQMNQRIINQIICVVKRKIFGIKVNYPILLSFYGEIGAGKNETTQLLFSPLDKHNVRPIKDCNELFGNKDWLDAFEESYVLILNEWGGLNNNLQEKLLDIIDGKEFHFNRKYENGMTRIKHNCTLVGTSNKRIKDIFNFTKGVRKLCEIVFRKYPTNIEQKENVWQKLNQFNFLELWQSVDENAAEPLEAVYDEFIAWTTAKLIKNSDINIWFSKLLSSNEGKHLTLGALQLNQKQYYEANEVDKKYRMNRKAFIEYLRDSGCKPDTVNNKRVWLLPKITNSHNYLADWQLLDIGDTNLYSQANLLHNKWFRKGDATNISDEE
jgi:hypothetical protein